MDIGEISQVTKTSESASDRDLRAALAQAAKAARRGHGEAQEALQKRRSQMTRMQAAFKAHIEAFRASASGSRAEQAHIEQQLRSLIGQLKTDVARHEQLIAVPKSRLDEFHVVLFGRTMAGKSTLRELLTHGDGSTRGTGSQRTTRDVRSYHWGPLKVTDVPGVAAFEGEADEIAAYAAAKQADLVLFLITDTAPGPAEALHLARILALGKPVIGICNVQHAVSRPKELRRFRRVWDTRMSERELAPLFTQFVDMARQHEPRAAVRFTPVHLEARFLAGQDPDGPQASELRALSNFEVLEERVIEDVVGRAASLRLRTFLDGVSLPARVTAGALLEGSRKNRENAGLVAAKKSQLDLWRGNFVEESRREVTSAVAEMFRELEERIPAFVEECIESREIGQQWKREVDALDLESKSRELSNELIDQAMVKVQVLGRELMKELSISHELDQLELQRASILDSRRILGWGFAISQSALIVGALVYFVGPLVLVSMVLSGLWSRIMGKVETRQEKLQRARLKMEKRLRRKVGALRQKVEKRLQKWLKDELHAGLLGNAKEQLKGQRDVLRCTAETQAKEAQALEDLAQKCDVELVHDAFSRLGISLSRPLSVGRRAGAETFIWIRGGAPLSKNESKRLAKLLGERVEIFYGATPPPRYAVRSWDI